GDATRAGIDPALIYAFEQTGLLVTADNEHLIPEHDLHGWRAAAARYNAQHNPPWYSPGTLTWEGAMKRGTNEGSRRPVSRYGQRDSLRGVWGGWQRNEFFRHPGGWPGGMSRAWHSGTLAL